MSRAVGAGGDLLHHVNGETDHTHAPEEFLDAQGDGDERVGIGIGKTEVQVDDVRDVEAEAEGEKGLSQTDTRDIETTKQGTDHVGTGSEGAVDIAKGLIGQPESAVRA